MTGYPENFQHSHEISVFTEMEPAEEMNNEKSIEIQNIDIQANGNASIKERSPDMPEPASISNKEASQCSTGKEEICNNDEEQISTFAENISTKEENQKVDEAMRGSNKKLNRDAENADNITLQIQNDENMKSEEAFVQKLALTDGISTQKKYQDVSTVVVPTQKQILNVEDIDAKSIKPFETVFLILNHELCSRQSIC